MQKFMVKLVMTLIRDTPKAIVLNLLGGKLWVCENSGYSGNSYAGTNIEIEIPEEDGGLTLPSGLKIYTETDVIYWSSHYSFLDIGLNVKGHTRLKTRVTKTRQRTLCVRETAILELSDIFYDLLIAGALPMKSFPTAYLTDRKMAMHNYDDKFKAVEVALNELNALSLQEADGISEYVSYPYRHQFRQVQF